MSSTLFQPGPAPVVAKPVALGPWRTGLAVLCIGLTSPAWAGNVTASASQNLVGLVTNTDPGSVVSAYWPDMIAPLAFAITERDRIQATALGGTLVTQALAASGGFSTNYTLWDLSTNAALDGVLASTISLNFNFRVTGTSSLQAQSVSTVSTSYNAAIFSTGFQTAGDFLSGSYGPTVPFPSEGFIWNGNQALLGSYDIPFTLTHNTSLTGLWTMDFATGASNGGSSAGEVRLSSLTLAGGQAPAGGMGVRLETGQVIPVTAVPEPGAAWLWLAGAGMLGLVRLNQRR